jgi:hypothetical protein
MHGAHHGHAASAVLDSLMSPLLAWRERRFAAALCHELLREYEGVVARCPDLPRLEVYRRVVAAYTLADDAFVAATLRRAQESFASWPAERNVTLRDVAHGLAVSEFLTSHPAVPWIHANLKRVVESSIPPGL